MRRPVVVALVAASLVAAPAGADVLCRTKARRVFVRASCKKGEVRVDLPKGPTGDQGAAPRDPVRLVDGAGLQVGLFAELYTQRTNLAVFEVNGRVVSLKATTTGFGSDGATFYHLTTDCSGQRLVSERRGALVRSGIVVGTTAYYAEDPIVPETPVATEFPPQDACFGGTMLPNGNCCTTGSFSETYGPATVAFDLPSLGFTPPFHVEP